MEIETIGLLSFGHFREVETLVLLSNRAVTVVLMSKDKEDEMEVWDAYNKEFEKIEGMALIRGEAIPDGVYHLVSDVIVRHADGTYLLMQRDSRKHFGGI